MHEWLVEILSDPVLCARIAGAVVFVGSVILWIWGFLGFLLGAFVARVYDDHTELREAAYQFQRTNLAWMVGSSFSMILGGALYLYVGE